MLHEYNLLINDVQYAQEYNNSKHNLKMSTCITQKVSFHQRKMFKRKLGLKHITMPLPITCGLKFKQKLFAFTTHYGQSSRSCENIY